MKYRLKVFLAALAVVFASEVTLGLNDYSDDQGVVFLIRLFVGCLVAGAFTFFWGEFRKNRSKDS